MTISELSLDDLAGLTIGRSDDVDATAQLLLTHTLQVVNDGLTLTGTIGQHDALDAIGIGSRIDAALQQQELVHAASRGLIGEADDVVALGLDGEVEFALRGRSHTGRAIAVDIRRCSKRLRSSNGLAGREVKKLQLVLGATLPGCHRIGELIVPWLQAAR